MSDEKLDAIVRRKGFIAKARMFQENIGDHAVGGWRGWECTEDDEVLP